MSDLNLLNATSLFENINRVKVTPLNKDNKTILIEDLNKKYVLRLKNTKNEFDSFKTLKEHGFSDMPNILFYDEKKGIVITEYLEGYKSLDSINPSIEEKQLISLKIKECLKKFQSIIVPNNFYDSFSPNLDTMLDKAIAEGAITEEDKDTITEFFSKSKELKENNTFKFSDMNMGNIVYNEETKDIKFIDFEFSSYGSKYYDIADMKHNFNKEYLSAFSDEELNNNGVLFFDFDLNYRWYLNKKEEKFIKNIKNIVEEMKKRNNQLDNNHLKSI